MSSSIHGNGFGSGHRGDERINSDSFDRWNTSNAEVGEDGKEYLSDTELRRAGISGAKLDALSAGTGKVTWDSVQQYTEKQHTLKTHQNETKQAFRLRDNESITRSTKFTADDFALADVNGDQIITFDEWKSMKLNTRAFDAIEGIKELGMTGGKTHQEVSKMRQDIRNQENTAGITLDEFTDYITNKQGVVSAEMLQNSINKAIQSSAHAEATRAVPQPDWGPAWPDMVTGRLEVGTTNANMDTTYRPATQAEINQFNTVTQQHRSNIAAATATSLTQITNRVNSSNWQSLISQFLDGDGRLRTGLTVADVNAAGLDPIIASVLNNYIKGR